MTRWILAAMLILSGLPLAAGKGKQGPQVEFRVTRFDPDDRPSPEFQVGSGDKQIDVEVPLTYIAGPFKVPLRDERFLDFWRGDGEKPELSIPITEAERKNLLLFFIPAEESFKVIKVRTPLQRLRGGDRYLINASSRQLAIKAGSAEPIYLNPGKGVVIRGPGGDDVTTMPVLVSEKRDDAWKLASTETWYCDPRFRKYLFAYPSLRTGQLMFHSVSERL